MKQFLIINILTLCAHAYAQTSSLQKIRVSAGSCASPCGYDKGFHDVAFDRQLEYTVKDGTIRYKNKLDDKPNVLAGVSSQVFADNKLHASLDSLYDHFEDFKASPGKYYIYRLELAYSKSETGLPLKIKAMEFWVSTNPERTHPKVIDLVIEEYRKIILTTK